MSSVVQAMEYRGVWLHYILLERGASRMSSMMSVRKGVRNADTSADAVGIESAGESLQLAYELHAQPRGLLIIRPTAPEQGTSGTIWYHFIVRPLHSIPYGTYLL